MQSNLLFLLVAGIVSLGLPSLTRGGIPDATPAPRPAKISKLARDVRLLLITVEDSTGQALPEFLVLAGVEAGSVSEEFEKRTGRTVVNWQPHTARIAKGGQYAWPLDRAYDRMYLRIEADGFQSQIAGPVKQADGPQLVEFRLETDRHVGGRILTPDRKPAEGATVALALVQKNAALENGYLRGTEDPLPTEPSDRWRRPLVVKTDNEGRFKLPNETGPAAVLVVHDSGVKELSLRPVPQDAGGDP